MTKQNPPQTYQPPQQNQPSQLNNIQYQQQATLNERYISPGIIKTDSPTKFNQFVPQNNSNNFNMQQNVNQFQNQNTQAFNQQNNQNNNQFYSN